MCVRYRVFTVPRKFTIGDVATFDIKAARKKAREVRQAAAEGIDHSALKRASKVAARDGKGESGTFTFVARNFINRYARAKNRRWVEVARLLGLRPSKDKPGELILIKGGVAERWQHRLVDSVTKPDVLAVLDDLMDAEHAVTANRTFSALRRLYSWRLPNPGAGKNAGYYSKARRLMQVAS